MLQPRDEVFFRRAGVLGSLESTAVRPIYGRHSGPDVPRPLAG